LCRTQSAFTGPIAKPKQYGPAGNGINWTIYADNAEPKTGEIECHKMLKAHEQNIPDLVS